MPLIAASVTTGPPSMAGRDDASNELSTVIAISWAN